MKQIVAFVILATLTVTYAQRLNCATCSRNNTRLCCQEERRCCNFVQPTGNNSICKPEWQCRNASCCADRQTCNVTLSTFGLCRYGRPRVTLPNNLPTTRLPSSTGSSTTRSSSTTRNTATTSRPTPRSLGDDEEVTEEDEPTEETDEPIDDDGETDEPVDDTTPDGDDNGEETTPSDRRRRHLLYQPIFRGPFRQRFCSNDRQCGWREYCQKEEICCCV